jgi:hypothetical protein
MANPTTKTIDQVQPGESYANPNFNPFNPFSSDFWHPFLTKPAAPVNANPSITNDGTSLQNTQVGPGTTSKATPVVSSGTAATQAGQIQTTIQNHDAATANNTAANQQKTAANQTAMANTSQQFLPDGTLNPNYKTPPPVQQTTDDKVAADVANPNTVAVYNSAGQQVRLGKDQMVNGQPPAGYSMSNPRQGSVVSSIPSGNGGTINQMADGSYWAVDINGNYQKTSADTYQSATTYNTARTALANIQQGILTPDQQAQIDNLKAIQKQDMDNLVTRNANTTGAQTLAENMYGMGSNSIGQGEIQKVITDGANKVTAFQVAQAKAIADMKQGFVDDDAKMISAAYSSYRDSLDAITTSIKDTTTAAKAMTDKSSNDLTNFTFQAAHDHPDADIHPGMSLEQIQDAIINSKTFQDKQQTIDMTPVDGNGPPSDSTLANTPSSITGKSLNALWQDANDYALSGKSIQSYIGGLSSANQSNAYKVAISNKSAAIMAAAGVDKSALQQQYKANSQTLNSLTKYMNNMDLYVTKAEGAVNQVVNIFGGANINMFDPTILNKTINDLSKNFTDSSDIRAYQAGIAEVAADYAQIFNRGGVTTEGGSQRANDILSGNITLKDFQKITDTLAAQGKINVDTSINQMQKVATGGVGDVVKYLQYVHNAENGTVGGNSTGGGQSGDGTNTSPANGRAF